MSEYISRDTLNKILSDRIDMNDKCLNGAKENKQFEDEKYFFTLIFEDEQIKSLIEESDPANVRENIHGEWIENAPENQFIDPPYICSECGRAELRKENFCPSCGADMREPKGEKGTE